ncbi:pyridoxal phosphate-dependent transferase [Cryomyces antarcticus]
MAASDVKYAYNFAVEELRDREYPQIQGKTYLDHGGTTLYAKSLIEAFSADMISNLYGNPHSDCSPSKLAGHRIDEIRERALRFFNASPDEFDLVFVPNATAGVKLVADCFRDYAAASNTPFWYGYHRDAHTSLVGVREATKGFHRCFTSDEEVETWIEGRTASGHRRRQLDLFAYPGQSNMTGRRLPLDWPGKIRKNSQRVPTYTLLDAAALASTSPLDLSNAATAPDFVALSFYKIFGFPNLGALIVRKVSAHILDARSYFGGGTVDMVVNIGDTWHAKKDVTVHDRLEDGTLPFLNIFALDAAMRIHTKLFGSMKQISMHCVYLAHQLYSELSQLRHCNDTPVVRIYKDANAIYGNSATQGATIAFNVLRADGSLVGYVDVEKAADEQQIYVRSGSLCNPGGVATYLKWTPPEMRAAFAAGHKCSNPTQVVKGKSTGVVRVSLGAMSTRADVETLLDFMRQTYVETELDVSDTEAEIFTAIPQALHVPASPSVIVSSSHGSQSPSYFSSAPTSAPSARTSPRKPQSSMPTTPHSQHQRSTAQASPSTTSASSVTTSETDTIHRHKHALAATVTVHEVRRKQGQTEKKSTWSRGMKTALNRLV